MATAGKAAKEAATAVATGLTSKKYVMGGPQLWVSTLLHEKGALSTNRIYEEFLRDKETPNRMIPSKTFLKNRILHQMLSEGKIKKDRALDMPEYKRGGWTVIPTKAFKNTAPEIIMKLDPIPQLERQDLREYIEKQFELFEEVLEKEDATMDEAIKQSREKH